MLIDRERPSLFSDCWSLGAVLLHWIMDLPPWDLQVTKFKEASLVSVFFWKLEYFFGLKSVSIRTIVYRDIDLQGDC